MNILLYSFITILKIYKLSIYFIIKHINLGNINFIDKYMRIYVFEYHRL